MMSDNAKAQGDSNSYEGDERIAPKYEQHKMDVPGLGSISVFVQGARSYSEVVILTVHDLGCDHTMYQEFVDHPLMCKIRDRTVWINVVIPGQGLDVPELPADYMFPTMQQIAESLHHVLDKLKIKEVVCFGEGAGANILARFAIAQPERVLGLCVLHCTGTTAGFLESLKDKVINWKLEHIGMNPTAESYLVLHRFGTANTEFTKASNQDQLKSTIENFQSVLRTKTNPKNLKKFVDAFLKRTSIAEKIHRLKCNVLMVTGQKSLFSGTTHALHQTLLKSCSDKTKVEFIEVVGVANVLEEKPEKLTECFQYFLQGLGLVSSVPMHHIGRPIRVRSLSMEEYDKPLRQRSMSGSSGSPMSTSPPKVDPRPQPVA